MELSVLQGGAITSLEPLQWQFQEIPFHACRLHEIKVVYRVKYYSLEKNQLSFTALAS